MRIQDIKVVYICPDNNKKYNERKIHMDNLLKDMGFNDIVHHISGTEEYPKCLKQATIDVLTKYIDWPFILLEDDVESTGHFNFDFVPGADAIYFGLTKFDDPESVSHYSDTQIRLNNMPCTHAVLYISKQYKQATINLLQESLNTESMDKIISKLQSKFLILANRQPLFYQSENYGSSNEINTNIEIIYKPIIKDNYFNKRMKIGITAQFSGSAFNSSLPQVAVYLGRALKSLGHSVVFLIKVGSNKWFDDCLGACNIESIEISTDFNYIPYDIVLEVAWFLNKEDRKKLAKKNVMFIHEPAIFKDMEKTVYNLNGGFRDYNNIDALWTWSHISKNDVYYLSMLSRLPVFLCPFVWEPIFLEGYTTISDLDTKQTKQILICENNRTNQSSCIIPLTILSKIIKANSDVKWTISNASTIYKKEYFKKNTVDMLNLGTDIDNNFKDRVRIVDYVNTNSCIISHQRWLPLKYTLLDAMYLGIPLIHNCKLIKSLKGGEHYYEYNQISQALRCWSDVNNESVKPDINSVRKELLERWGPDVIKREIPTLIAALYNK